MLYLLIYNFHHWNHDSDTAMKKADRTMRWLTWTWTPIFLALCFYFIVMRDQPHHSIPF